MASVSKGTTCLYGVAGTVTNLYVQSYSVSSSFNNEDTVQDEAGLTKTWRADDRKSEITVEGIVKVGTVPELGASFSFTVAANTAYPSGSGSTSFAGWVTKVDEKGGNKEFVKVSVTAVDYEGVAP
jgi:uncharacterized protein affecting Mg2+/Co2+ transport